MRRRDFLGASSLAALPLLSSFPSLGNSRVKSSSSTESPVNMVLDGHFHEPDDYIQKLSEIAAKRNITGDFYSEGGIVSELEEEFRKITGKERALYMPSGTMANETALRFLCGNKSKAIVHADSHIFKDEADAAQVIHQKRLVPIDTGKHFFSVEDLKLKLQELENGEAFYSYSNVGALSIENPVRRHQGKMVDLGEINKVCEFAKSQGIRTHLDGARIHLATAYSGISVQNYCAGFDTVYISLYKYLGAAGGAIIAGDAETLEKMKKLMKVLGGTVFRSWSNAAVALHYVQGIDARLNTMVQQSRELIKSLNELDEIEVKGVENGTNVFFLSSTSLDLEKFSDEMNENHNVWMHYPENGKIQLHMNESILDRGIDSLLDSFKAAVRKA